MADVFDAKNGIRIPHVFFGDRRAEDPDELGRVGFGEEIAWPVRERPVQIDLSVRLQAENILQLGIEGVGSPIGIAVRGSAHIAPFAAEQRPAALGRADHPVIGPQRVEHAAVAAQLAHRSALGDIERNRAQVAGAVEHGDHDRRFAAGEGRHTEREPRVIVVVRHADERHRRGQSERATKVARAARRRVELGRAHERRFPGTEQAEARRELLEDGAEDRRRERRIVPGGEPGSDALRPDPGALHRAREGVDRMAREVGAVLLAREALFLVVAQDARTVLAR